MKITLIFLITLSLNADTNEILKTYRTKGIQTVQKQLDLELSQKKYWSGYIKDMDTKFGYIESSKNILVCNKTDATLSLYKRNHKGTYLSKKKYNAFTGEVAGDKKIEGDLKTPIGIYKITKTLTKLDSFYGPVAFVTSYPNLYDKYRGKNGHGIWIHGLPQEEQREKFTKGCIAINNKNIMQLKNNIDTDKTLLIINNSTIIQHISKNTLSSILAQLYSWRYSWLYNDISGYLNFYSKSFKRYDGLNISNFQIYKTRIFNQNNKKTILFTKIEILPYPNSQSTYQINFKESYRSKNFSFDGDKTLIITMKDDKMKILTER